MLVLFSFMAALAAGGALAIRYGVDSRRDDGRQL
ncbi:MAG: hypothetical protein QOJ21_3603 [Solirubrobacteraceae bacterium]|jgi:hypothetical protein|nr:hypothetical protein [Solirubrobacteraceae bacterium]